MTAGGTRYMTLEPCINAFLVKPMDTVIKNANGLSVFHGILTDGTIIRLWIEGSKNSGGINLLLGGSNDDRFHKRGGWYRIRKLIEERQDGFGGGKIVHATSTMAASRDGFQPSV